MYDVHIPSYLLALPTISSILHQEYLRWQSTTPPPILIFHYRRPSHVPAIPSPAPLIAPGRSRIGQPHAPNNAHSRTYISRPLYIDLQALAVAFPILHRLGIDNRTSTHTHKWQESAKIHLRHIRQMSMSHASEITLATSKEACSACRRWLDRRLQSTAVSLQITCGRKMQNC